MPLPFTPLPSLHAPCPRPTAYRWWFSRDRGGGCFDDVPFQTRCNFQKFRFFGGRDPDAVERCGDVRHEGVVPFRFCNAHSLVRELHVTARIIDRSLKAGAEEVNYELVAALRAVFANAFPVYTKRRIGAQSRHQLVHEGGDHIVSAEALIQGLLSVSGTLGIEHLISPPVTANALPLG